MLCKNYVKASVLRNVKSAFGKAVNHWTLYTGQRIEFFEFTILLVYNKYEILLKSTRNYDFHPSSKSSLIKYWQL